MNKESAKKFEVGKMYRVRVIGGYMTEYAFRVIKRTKATITISGVGLSRVYTCDGPITRRILKKSYSVYGCEAILPTKGAAFYGALKANDVFA